MKRSASTKKSTPITTSEARTMCIETIKELRNGSMTVDRGMAIGFNMKALNDNIKAEIDAAKLILVHKEAATKFGKLVEMGKLKIAC